jgi:hypothetical protein
MILEAPPRLHIRSTLSLSLHLENPLGYLFSTIDAKRMLSLIASPLSVDELAHHMRPYLIAMTFDTVEWPIRWGDTRVLPGLLETLPESQCDYFLSPVKRWWSAGRDGGLLRWEGPASSPAPAEFLACGGEIVVLTPCSQKFKEKK